MYEDTGDRIVNEETELKPGPGGAARVASEQAYVQVRESKSESFRTI